MMTEHARNDDRPASPRGRVFSVPFRRVIRPLSAATLLLVLALGCRGGDGVTGPDEEAASLDVTPASVSLVPGDTAQMEATPVDEDGNPVSGYEISWSSEDTTVATVDGEGTVTALSAGSTQITASAAKKSHQVKKKGLKNQTGVTVTESGLITDLEPTSYEKGTLLAEDSVYIDREYTIEGMPSEYEGWRYVRTANDDKDVTDDSVITFTLEDTARVALAYDERATTLPDWLREWTATGDTLRTTDVDHLIYTRQYLPGDVALGGNQSGGAEGAESMYVLAATRTDSAPDDGDSTGGDSTDATGSLEVATATSGDSLDSDGYTVSVDVGSERSLDLNDTTVYADLAAEDHSVALSDVASNCSISGENPRSVTIPENDTASTAFEVTCEATGVDSSESTPVTPNEPEGYSQIMFADGSIAYNEDGAFGIPEASEWKHFNDDTPEDNWTVVDQPDNPTGSDRSVRAYWDPNTNGAGITNMSMPDVKEYYVSFIIIKESPWVETIDPPHKLWYEDLVGMEQNHGAFTSWDNNNTLRHENEGPSGGWAIKSDPGMLEDDTIHVIEWHVVLPSDATAEDGEITIWIDGEIAGQTTNYSVEETGVTGTPQLTNFHFYSFSNDWGDEERRMRWLQWYVSAP